jgi:Cu+-exporting ATPase
MRVRNRIAAAERKLEPQDRALLETDLTGKVDPSRNVDLPRNQQRPQCAHCGDFCDSSNIRLPAFVERSATQDSADQSNDIVFCCNGCRTVYEILRDHAMCDYYAVGGTPAGVSMRSATHTRFASRTDYESLDDSSVVRTLVSYFSESRQRIVWHVPSLHCASCVWLLEQLDRFDSGILFSEVDIFRKTVTVDVDPRRTTLRRVAESMARVGYAPVIQADSEGDGNSNSASAPQSQTTSRSLYAKIGVAGFAAGNTMMIYVAQYFAQPEHGSQSLLGPKLQWVFGWLSILLSVPVLLYSASPWFVAAWAALRRKRVTLDVPVALGIATLFVRSAVDLGLGSSEGYLDSFNGLVFFLLIGRLFQQKAFDALSFDRTYRSFFPLSVRVERAGEHVIVPIEQIAIGERLLVRNAEVVPCEAVLQTGAAYLDYSFVTGEAQPVECIAGSIVHPGGRVIGRAAELVATKRVSHTELSAMWGRSARSAKRRPLILDISDVFGKWFTSVALAVAVLGAALWLPDLKSAFDVFTAVLIIACPCALTLAAPITLGTAMGVLGKFGIYLKHISVLIELPRITSVYFDKTGTLTFSDPDILFRGRDLTEDEWRTVRGCSAIIASAESRNCGRRSRNTLRKQA